ncbi:MAG: DUF2007 domain-containing protein [Verrucomicrobia bacterium]|nr:DUF2007 domain-containing protein [Verrucomicrobiota bacterium]
MKELFREREFERVAFFRQVLEDEGIPTMIRNENLTMSGLSEIPIPEFFPALCVMNDDDYPRAVAIIRARLDEEKSDPGEDIGCPACGESNPGNFSNCWSCEAPLRPEVVG